MVSFLALIILILSIILHEVAHGYAANALGDPTARLAGRLTLNPLPHIDPLGSVILPALLVLTNAPILFGWAKPVPYNPYNLRQQRWGEALVALAGSATNLGIACLFALIVRYGAVGGFDATMLLVAQSIVFVNLFLGLFNLIPFPPLDGFTALRSLLPWRLGSGLHQFEQRIHASGPFALMLFLVAFSYLFSGVFFSLVLWLFGLLIGGT